MTYPDAPAEQPAKPAPSKGAKIAGVVIVLLMLGACITTVTKALGSSSDSTPVSRADEAKSICETFVKRQLKAPSTAKFSDESATLVTGAEYTSTGSVDSQNSFGAMLRMTYACDMTYDAASKEWTSKSVSVK